MQLRPYQTDLVDDIRQSLKTGKRSICAVLGCGGGKSIIQGMIAKMATEKQNNVLFIVHRKELCQQIADTFAECEVDFKKCEIGMVQTVIRRTLKLTKDPPKILLVDEAHHILSKTYQNIITAIRSVNPKLVVVGFTATPIRLKEGGLGGIFEELIKGVSTKWLIDNGYLAPYVYKSIPVVDRKRLKRVRMGEFVQSEVAELMEQSVIYGDSVANWLKFAEGKQTIVYCASVESSKSTAAAYKQQGITAEHLDGTTPDKIRDDIIDRFRKGEIKVLCNVDLFGEGFDVPDCQCVQLLRPTKSLSLHIQQSMRSMRSDKKGPDGRNLNKVALILDHVGNVFEHGLPDMEHEWTLETKKRKEENVVKLKECPQCFGVVGSGEEVCPLCGFVFPKPEPRADLEKTEGDLETITEERLFEERKRRKIIRYQRTNDYRRCCTSLLDLMWFAEAHKYHRLWAFHKAAEMHLSIPQEFTKQMYAIGYRHVNGGWIQTRKRV